MSAAPVAESNDVNGSRPSFLARFMRNQSGSTAIEFAVLAIPFSLLVFAILESCIAFAGQQVLANAADEVARQLRTGQEKAAGFTEEKLKDQICAKLQVLVSKDCKAQLVVDLRSYPTFADAAKVKLKLTSDRDIDTTGFAVTPGPSMSKNMLQVIYKWPVITDFMRASMSNLKDGKTLQYATVTWQNEPFND
ncbi:pilus assembly protein [Aminobacter carboxidus]|uniref:Pilus assembly protein n=1 Tax=Aminobacter carboxidus TaxID=376165 RepID=A0A8E1WJK8_9HYPH|nr:TadE/TadG family type IV pilus assembly protein [Aminobacter lissarensis]MBB6469683.1 Flp pilus assembly protein TadG [Aminobacter lissarensis]MBE1205721.1 pilus assembly protein [Aminobacter carboxidus]